MSEVREDVGGKIRTLEDQLRDGVEFDVELWRDIARRRIDELDEEGQQIVNEAVAALLWYMGVATCTRAQEPSEADYRRLRECCSRALTARNTIREVFLKHDGYEVEEWRDEDDRSTSSVRPLRPTKTVLH